MINSPTSLIELRHQYVTIIAQFQRRAFQAKAKIDHIDALLVDELLRGKAFASASPARLERLESSMSPMPLVASASAPSPKAKTRPNPDEAVQPTKVPSVAGLAQPQDSLPLQPDYQGMTKLQAITKALTSQPDLVLHQNRIIELLYGALSSDQMRLESRRMRASLFQGLQKGLWQRASEPSSYIALAKDLAQSPQSAPDASQPQGKISATLSRAKFLPKLVKLKPGKPPTARTRKKSSKTSDQPERKQLEIVALLRKPSFSL